MNKEILKFGDIKIEENEFCHHKSFIFFKRCRY